jgi:hypothetical protein
MRSRIDDERREKREVVMFSALKNCLMMLKRRKRK